MKSRLRLIFAAAAAVHPALVSGQSLETQPVACKGQIVSRIEVHTRPPFEIGGSKMQQRLARQVTALHATTNPEIIRRFLELKPGQPCTELRRSESERILRAQPYLADASVLAFPGDGGTVSISVLAVDEISLILGGGGSGKSPYIRGFKLGEANLMGEAMSLDGRWHYNADFRDEFTVRFTDYQLLGRPYQLSVELARRERGQDWELEASHPFLTDLQHLSWRTTAGSNDSYTRFRRPDGTSIFLPFSRDFGDIGGVGRIGRPGGEILLIGGSLSYEREMPGGTPLMLRLPERELGPEPDTALIGRYGEHRTTRINALFGFRHVDFMEASGFESLDGLQDMRRGFEVGTLFGKGIRSFGARDQDFFGSADVYAGFGSPRLFTAMEVMAEARRPEGGGRWDGKLASGRWAIYGKARETNTVVAGMEWSAGWNQRIPFQLALADKRGGPLGYRLSTLAGGRRIVTRIEDRIVVGHLKQFATIGVAPFINTGQLWAGDAPYGIDSGIRTSLGISVLASVPPKSQRLWRLDLAFPLQRDYGEKWTIRLLSHNFTRMFWKEPNDVGRNREKAIPTSIFNWP